MIGGTQRAVGWDSLDISIPPQSEQRRICCTSHFNLLQPPRQSPTSTTLIVQAQKFQNTNHQPEENRTISLLVQAGGRQEQSGHACPWVFFFLLFSSFSSHAFWHEYFIGNEKGNARKQKRQRDCHCDFGSVSESYRRHLDPG